MEIRKYLAVFSLICATSAGAQSTTLSKVSVTNVFTKMTAVNAADLALRSQVGDCKAIAPAAGSAKYVLTWYESGVKKTQRFGVVQAQLMEIEEAQSALTTSVERSYTEKFISELKNSIFIPSAHAALPSGYDSAYMIPVHSMQAVEDAKAQLGNKVKSLALNSKCGTVTMTAFNRDISQMKDDLKFYMVDGNIKCTALGFVKKIREPGSCTYKEVESPLPNAACRMLYRTYSTVKSRVENEVSVPTVAPVLQQMTPEVALNFAVDAVLQANPELELVANAAELTHADHVLPNDVLTLIETKQITAANFDTFTASEKKLVSNLVNTVDALQGETAYLQPSSSLTNIATAVKTKVQAYLAANPSITAETYIVPKKTVVASHLDQQLAPVVAVTNQPFNYNLGCLQAQMALSVQEAQHALMAQ